MDKRNLVRLQYNESYKRPESFEAINNTLEGASMVFLTEAFAERCDEAGVFTELRHQSSGGRFKLQP